MSALHSTADEQHEMNVESTFERLPNELQAGCPFHKSLDGTDARELSEFGHELERGWR